MTTPGSEPQMRVPLERAKLIFLDGAQNRDASCNAGTICGLPMGLPQRVPTPAPAAFEALFVAHYPSMRAMGRSLTSPGVAVIAVHASTGSLAGRAWFRAQPGSIHAAIIGRHSQADLMLRDDEGLSLRHLAVVVHPLESWDAHDARFSVLDLRTSQAFRDERGRQLEGIRAEGPALLTCSQYALFFLQTGDPSDWPALATDAWQMLPERVFLDERSAEPDRWRRRARRHLAAIDPPVHGPEQTGIISVRGPASVEEPLIADEEAPLGVLRVRSERGARSLSIGPAAARRGILLGRYGRCDGADLLGINAISRSHLLILRVDDALYAIDTASTNGTYDATADQPDEPTALVRLDRPKKLILAEDWAEVLWQPAGDGD